VQLEDYKEQLEELTATSAARDALQEKVAGLEEETQRLRESAENGNAQQLEELKAELAQAKAKLAEFDETLKEKEELQRKVCVCFQRFSHVRLRLCLCLCLCLCLSLHSKRYKN